MSSMRNMRDHERSFPLPKKKLKYVCERWADYGLNESSSNYTDAGVRFIRTSDIDDSGNLVADGV